MDKIQELIKKYRITPNGDKIRVELIKEASDEELAEIKASKPLILQYFRDLEDKKRREDELAIKKARHGEDGFIFVIDYDLSFDTRVLVARRLRDEEKKRYSEWFAEAAFAPVGGKVTLKHIKFSDMPKRKIDGTFSGGSDSVWIITPEEYDAYIKENENRERAIQEKDAEEERLQKEKVVQYEKEKAELISQVDDWEVSGRDIYDEGGKTKVYHHRFLIGGETLSFTERNVFDFGIVINPDYEISPDKSGGIVIRKDGTFQWHTLSSDKGWIPIRPLTEHEKICWTIVAKYGKFAGTGIRM